MPNKEYHAGILYILDETIVVHRLGKYPETNTWEKDEKFLTIKRPKMGFRFVALKDKSEISLAVVRKLERGFKKPIFKSIGEVK